MRLLKLTIITLFILVGVAFGITQLSVRLSGDRLGPQIHLPEGPMEVSVRNPEALLEGVTATDRRDGDLTDRVQILSISKLINADSARVTFLVFDNDDNMCAVTSQFRYTDYQAPRFHITEPLVYAKNEPIPLLDRLSVTDADGTDITDAVRVSALSATADPEVHTVALQVTNSMGDTVRVRLPVILMQGTSVRPKVELVRQLIYLDKGDPFNARSFVTGVTLPNGEGDGDVTKVQITGQVDTQTPGNYMVYYRYPYGNGVEGLSILTVVVQ